MNWSINAGEPRKEHLKSGCKEPDVLFVASTGLVTDVINPLFSL